MKKYEAQDEFDRTISETEQAFMRILESSQTLLHVLKKEDQTLTKKRNMVQTRKCSFKNEDNQSVQQSAEKKIRQKSVNSARQNSSQKQ